MAAPQGAYPPGGQPQDGYGQEQDKQYEEHTSQTSASQPNAPTASGAPGTSHGSRKKRAYAGQAYEFGAGANSALGGQLQGGGGFGYSAPSQPQGYAQPLYGEQAQVASPTFGQPDPVTVGGYQPPAAGYPSQAPPTLGQVTQQFGEVGIGNQQPGGQQQPTAQRVHALNQLYPTDLLTHAFNVAELDFPPPP